MSKRLPPGPAANGAGSQTNGKCRIKWIAVSLKPVISNGLKVATIQERENSPSIEMRKKKKTSVYKLSIRTGKIFGYPYMLRT